jgi:hypothetical protein
MGGGTALVNFRLEIGRVGRNPDFAQFAAVLEAGKSAVPVEYPRIFRCQEIFAGDGLDPDGARYQRARRLTAITEK